MHFLLLQPYFLNFIVVTCKLAIAMGWTMHGLNEKCINRQVIFPKGENSRALADLLSNMLETNKLGKCLKCSPYPNPPYFLSYALKLSIEPQVTL